MEQYERLRKEYPRFYYHGYETRWEKDRLLITYDFEIEGLSSFAPQWVFPLDCSEDEGAESRVTEEMIFSLGMVELVSYWKITCSPEVYVEAGKLDPQQIRWLLCFCC